MRKFLSLMVAMMLLASSSFATTIYCKMDKSWWKADGAAVAVHHWGGETAATTWPGVRMTPVEGDADVWSYDVPADVTGLIFVRVNGSGNIADWGAKTADLTIPTDGKNLYTVTSESPVWGDPGVAGVWSVYGEEPVPVIPAKYYITGDSALVVNMGLSADKAWAPNAMKAEQDTMVLNLAAGDYKLKVTVDGTWATGKGYSDLTAQAEGLSDDADNNIVFTLADAGAVTVVYTESAFVLSGDFYVEPIVPVIVKDLKLVPGVWAEADAVLAAWTWGAEAAGAWSVFGGEGDTLIAKVNEHADSVVFVRFEAGAAIDWSSTIWNRYEDSIAECGILFVNDWDNYTWCEAPAPVEPAKYYITGDSALVVNMGLTADKAWAPNAMKAEQDTMVLNLAAGDYKLKVTVDGTWATGKGYSDLTAQAEGLSDDADNNIVFTLADAGAVTVVYTESAFVLSGDFYVEPIVPVIVKDLKLVPGVWANDSAVLAAWTWGAEAEGAWSVFAGEGDTLIAKVNEKADSVVFVRFAAHAAIDWASTIWNRAQDAIDECGIFFVNDWDNYSWCAAPAPVVPAKYYITGDSALVGAELQWHPDAIKVMEEEHVLNLAAGDYKLKVTVDGTWATVKGYEELSEKVAGQSTDGDNNIIFTLAEAGNVTVVYNDSVFMVSGNFYVEPIVPVVVKDLKLVPGVWANDSAVLAAWTWGAEAEGAWSVFAGEGDTLIAKINEKADSVVFVRFAAHAAIDWASTIWNRAQDAIDECGIFFVNDWDNYSWCAAPAPVVPAKYYITGDSALVGAELQWHPDAIKVMEEEHVLNLAAGDYKLKVTVDGTWATGKGYDDLTAPVEGLSADADNNIVFTLAEAGDVTVVYNDSVFTLSGNFYVKPAPVLENGFYLVGLQLNNWTPAAEYHLLPNPENEQEFMVAATLAEGDSLKVVNVVDDAITAWYPNGMNNNYVVDPDHAGETTLYFRPDYQGGEGWYEGCIYVVPTSTVGVENINAAIEAVKVVRNGQILIIRGEHSYTVMGQMMK